MEDKLKIFIAYWSGNGKGIAEHIKKHITDWAEPFLAPDDIISGEKNEKEYRSKKIQESDLFLIIYTIDCWKSEELINEIKVAKKIEDKKENFIQILKAEKADITLEEIKNYQFMEFSCEGKVTDKENALNVLLNKKDLLLNMYKKQTSEKNKQISEESTKMVSAREFEKITEKLVKKSKDVFYFYYPKLAFCLSEEIGIIRKIDNILKENDPHLQNINDVRFMFVLRPKEKNIDKKLGALQDQINKVRISLDKVRYIKDAFLGDEGGIIAGDKNSLYFSLLPPEFKGNIAINYTKQANAQFEYFYNHYSFNIQ